MTYPALFISHGAPTLPLQDIPASRFLKALGPELGRPKAILVISAHWERERPGVNAVATNATIHDFRGFARELYDITYPAAGSPDLARRVADLLGKAGLQTDIDTDRGLDHGAWVPLLLMYPEADIPVAQLSVQTNLGAAHHLALGRALQPLRDEGVLILASGSFTHNLTELNWGGGGEQPDWSRAFADWMTAAIMEHRTDDLLAWRERAPFAVRNHPTEEHLLPLFVALGAGGEAAPAERIHSSAELGSLRMDAFAFGTT